MKTIIAALITAIVSLVLALISIRPQIKGLGKDAQHHKDLLSMEHADLSKNLTRESANISNSVADLKKPLEFLQAARLKEEGRIEQAKGQALDMQKIMDQLLARERYIGELEQTVQHLKSENQKLHERCFILNNDCQPQLGNQPADREPDEPEL